MIYKYSEIKPLWHTLTENQQNNVIDQLSSSGLKDEIQQLNYIPGSMVDNIDIELSLFKWVKVNTAPSNWSGEYILVSSDDRQIANQDLANHYMECGDIVIINGTIEEDAVEDAGGKIFTIGNQKFIQSGTYSGKWSYSISYIDGNDSRKFLKYSSSGLITSGSLGSTNEGYWYIGFSSGKLIIANIYNTTTQLRFYNGHIQQIANPSSSYHNLSLFSLQQV